jgi:hypothetical protein
MEPADGRHPAMNEAVITPAPGNPSIPIGSSSTTALNLTSLALVGAALIAFALKAYMALLTFGTNDVVTFYQFARTLSAHGLEWTYRHDISFNHPPLTAYYLCFIYKMDQVPFLRENGINFPFLLRLPGIVADLVVALIVIRVAARDRRLRSSPWAVALFVLSPVSLMVSGFHGNTDPVMVMFLVLTAWFCLKENPWLAGLCFALSCQIKIVPLLLFPVLALFWWHRRTLVSFVIPFALASIVLWSQPLLSCPGLFLKNVLTYGSFWGLWGITYWLRLTDIAGLNMVTFYNFPWPEFIVVTALKIFIVSCVLLLAWRRRALNSRSLLDSIAYAWIIFFIFSPGVCAQYMVWLAPFILLLWPRLYGWFTWASALFLFFFYNITAHGLPWYLAVSTNSLNKVWTPWTIWPWLTLIAGAWFLWRKARNSDPSLRFVSLKIVRPEPNSS